MMTGNVIGFDYRPFVLNWIMSIKIIDGFVVNPLESLKAEWLYSQGRGRQFRIGEQDALAKYLSSVCPLFGEQLENENERKLRLILSKAQQHQRQLQEQVADPIPSSTSSSPSTLRRKGFNRVQSPRCKWLPYNSIVFHYNSYLFLVTRLSNRQNSPDSMSNSYHGSITSISTNTSQIDFHNNSKLGMAKSLIENFTGDVMSQSIDTISFNASINNSNTCSVTEATLSEMHSTNCIKQEPMQSQVKSFPILHNDIVTISGPLPTVQKMMPVPETLMSPDCQPTTTIAQNVMQISSTPYFSKTIRGKGRFFKNTYIIKKRG